MFARESGFVEQAQRAQVAQSGERQGNGVAVGVEST